MIKPKEELIRILKSNIKAFNSYRQETKHEFIDFSGSDLTGTNLCRADLQNVSLKDSELNFAYLHSAILKNADLSELTVGRADMTEADLSGAKMTGADLTNTILYGANLTSVKANLIILEGAKVREANFTGADLSNGNLSGLDLSGVNFENAILKGTDFTRANLGNALNLNSTIFDNTTIWPDSSSLPSDFNTSKPSKSLPTKSEEVDKRQGINADIGPGITSETQDYEFIDFPKPAHTEDRLPIGTGTTELHSPFDKEVEFTDELPDFEQFSVDQFEDIHKQNAFLEFQELEPGLASPPGEFEELPPEDPFTSSYTSSLGGTQQPSKQLGKISDQEFPIQSRTLAGNLTPHPDLVTAETHQKETTKFQKKAEPVPAAAKPVPSDQMNFILDVLNNINSKLDHIDREQKAQRSAIEELKKTSGNKLIDEMISHKVEDISMTTRSLFSRLESKVDIIVQTDPLDQIDSLLGELSDSLRAEQENIIDKILNLSTVIDSFISIVESDKLSTTEVDFTSLTNNFHQMLKNLESNVREDQDKVDQKIDDLATLIEGFSIVLENLQNELNQQSVSIIDPLSEEIKAINDKINNVSIEVSNVSNEVNNVCSEVYKANSEVSNVSDAVNNINNTVGALIELNQENTAESQIYEAFYDFEFRLQLEIEKNQNKLTDIETLFTKTSEKLNFLSEKSIHLDKLDKLDKLGTIETIPKLLETFRNQLFTEIQQTEQRTGRLREVVDDMVIQLESMFNMQLGSLKHSIESEIITTYKKMEELLKGNTLDLNQKVEELLEANTLNLNQKVGTLYGELEKSNGHLSIINNKINELGNKFEESRKEPKMDDEFRSIFEHLLIQVGEYTNSSEENTVKLSKKFEDLETELQMTLKDMDRRISKINSMIRNVYKALDGITDLITESSQHSTKVPSHSARKSLLTKTSDIDDDMDDDI